VTGNFGNELHGFWGAGGPALESEIPSRVRAQTEPGTGAAGMDFGKVLKACGDGNYGSRGPLIFGTVREGLAAKGRRGHKRWVVRTFGTVFVHSATMAASRFEFRE